MWCEVSTYGEGREEGGKEREIGREREREREEEGREGERREGERNSGGRERERKEEGGRREGGGREEKGRVEGEGGGREGGRREGGGREGGGREKGGREGIRKQNMIHSRVCASCCHGDASNLERDDSVQLEGGDGADDLGHEDADGSRIKFPTGTQTSGSYSFTSCRSTELPAIIN